MVAITRLLRLRPIHHGRVNHILHNFYCSSAAAVPTEEPDSVPNSSPPPLSEEKCKLLVDSVSESLKPMPSMLEEFRRNLSDCGTRTAADSPPPPQPSADKVLSDLELDDFFKGNFLFGGNRRSKSKPKRIDDVVEEDGGSKEKRILPEDLSKLLKTEKKDRLLRNEIKIEKAKKKEDSLVRNESKTESKENSLWSEELGDRIDIQASETKTKFDDGPVSSKTEGKKKKKKKKKDMSLGKIKGLLTMVSNEGKSTALGSSQKDTIETPESNEEREWTQVDEVSLKVELDRLINQGFNFDSMFKNGCGEHIVHALRKYKSCDYISQQDIISKIMAWRREYETLNDLISCDGIRFIKSRKEIAVDSEEAWDAYVKLHPEAKNMRDKVFRLYDTWKKLFGKDRVTEEVKEKVAKTGNNSLNMGEEDKAMSATISNAKETDAPTGSKDVESSDNEKKTTKKKRKSAAESVTEPVLKQMQEFFSNQNEEMKTICSSVKKLQEPSQVSDMYTLLEAVPELSMEQRVKVAMRLVKQRHELELFLVLPDDAKAKFVELIVQEMP